MKILLIGYFCLGFCYILEVLENMQLKKIIKEYEKEFTNDN